MGCSWLNSAAPNSPGFRCHQGKTPEISKKNMQFPRFFPEKVMKQKTKTNTNKSTMATIHFSISFACFFFIFGSLEMYDFSKRYLVKKNMTTRFFFFQSATRIGFPLSRSERYCWKSQMQRIWKLIAVDEIHVTPFVCVLFCFCFCVWRVSHFFWGENDSINMEFGCVPLRKYHLSWVKTQVATDGSSSIFGWAGG